MISRVAREAIREEKMRARQECCDRHLSGSVQVSGLLYAALTSGSSYFGARAHSPVTLRPDRAKLATIPDSTRPSTLQNPITIGIVLHPVHQGMQDPAQLIP
jgi:hypothetical protein